MTFKRNISEFVHAINNPIGGFVTDNQIPPVQEGFKISGWFKPSKIDSVLWKFMSSILFLAPVTAPVDLPETILALRFPRQPACGTGNIE